MLKFRKNMKQFPYINVNMMKSKSKNSLIFKIFYQNADTRILQNKKN